MEVGGATPASPSVAWTLPPRSAVHSASATGSGAPAATRRPISSSPRSQHLGVERRTGGAHDLAVARRAHLLVHVEQLLVELLAGTDAHHLDRDVAAGLVARELDHAAGEVDDPDRLAHVEHEDVAALGDAGGLDHQLHGLGDGHEEARHLGVGDRDRPALLDLALEDRQHRAGAAEDVAEAHGARSACRDAAPRASITRSARALEAPMTVLGSTALSVEIRQKRSTPYCSASRASTSVPRRCSQRPATG